MDLTTPLLTGEELTAIARGCGAPSFPAVSGTLYDDLDPDYHDRLDQRLLAQLLARGLIEVHGDGEPALVSGLEGVIAAVLTHRVHIAIDQLSPTPASGELRTCAVMAGDSGAVRHQVAEPLHRLALESGDAGLEARVRSIVSGAIDRAPGAGRPGRHTQWRGRTGFADLVPAPLSGWRRATALMRTDVVTSEVRVDGFLGVLDGGPGQLWLVTEADHGGSGEPPDELLMIAEPASAADVDAAIESFATIRPGSRY